MNNYKKYFKTFNLKMFKEFMQRKTDLLHIGGLQCLYISIISLISKWN